MTNCSFSGKIYATGDGGGNDLTVGGLFGYQRPHGSTKVYLTDCKTEGDIYINANKYIYYLEVGGIAASLSSGDMKNCVNRMNITVNPGQTISTAVLSGLSYAYPIVSQCVSLGTIKVGSEDNKAKITELYIGGLMEGSGYFTSCAFYGKFDIHSQGSYIYFNPLTQYYYKVDGTPSVVCSVGNVFDIDYTKTVLDQVCYEYSEGNHNCYYRFETATSNVTFPCKGTADASKYNKTLEEMKADGFISTLNSAAGGYVWLRYKGGNTQ